MGIRSLSTASISTGAKRSKFWDQSAVEILNSYESIQTVTVTSSSQATISFTSIPSTYTHLQIRCMTRSANTPSQWDSFYMTLNSDGAANYSDHFLRGSGTAMSVGFRAGSSNILIGYQPDNGYTSGIFGAFVIDILDYKNTNKNKTTRTLGGFDTNNTGSEVGTLAFTSGQWRSTDAVTSIQLVAGGGRNTIQNSTFALYGIKGA